jgi:hypothetical protein
MLPTVALPSHFHPRHHFDNRLSYSPYDLQDPTALLHRPFQQNVTRSSTASAPRTHMQFPHPIQRPISLDTGEPDVTKATKTGEHTLRRKTPNGTLAAGYDGTPGDRAIQPPAAKHILVSSLDTRQQRPSSQSGPPVDSYTWLPVDQASSLQHQAFPPAFQPDVGRHNINNNGLSVDHLQSGGAAGPSWVRSLNFQPWVDSVLHQSSPIPQSPYYYMHNGPSIPTVLPASLQSCLGPTAPVGTGPYGPYWPDGAYIPYRPAALRDSRFMAGSSVSPDTNSAHLFDLQAPFLNHSSFPASNFPNAAFSWNQLPSGSNHDTSTILHQNKFPPRHSHHPSLSTAKEQHRSNLPFHVRAASGLNTGLSPRPVPDAVKWHASYSVPPSLSDPQSRVQTAEFKEKVLSWAHGVYVDLLASLHHARKSSISKSSSDGQSPRNLKPAIYPKPPRQPGLDFSSHPDIPRHNSYPSSIFDLSPHGSARHMNSRQTDRSFSGLMFDQRTPAESRHMDGFQTIRKASGASLSQLMGSVPSESTIMASAASALEMLSHLCSESNWEWIDGMLLGGCLAYGLGDYQKATRWYSRIIARDPRYFSPF